MKRFAYVFFLCLLTTALPLGLTQPPAPTAESRSKWVLVSSQRDGNTQLHNDSSFFLSFAGNSFVLGTAQGTYAISASGNPRAIDLTFIGKDGKASTLPGIYDVTADAFTLCLPLTGRNRPTEFRTMPGDGRLVYYFKPAIVGEPVIRKTSQQEPAPVKTAKKGKNARPYCKKCRQPDNPGLWSVPDLCKAYSWPTNLQGGGVIAIVELDGGWTPADMNAYFQTIGQPMPHITDVSVDGAQNNPNKHDQDPVDPDREVTADIQIAAASYFVATGKPAVIRVYWAKNDNNPGAIAAALRKAAADGCDVCSISWGANEVALGRDVVLDMERAAHHATAAGMIIFAASGDNDSSDAGDDPGDKGPSQSNVDVPAACPHVIGCGGTTKTLKTETVWNDSPTSANGDGTGGGFSSIFPVQAFQAGAPQGPGRMVPDVAGNADPNTGYKIVVHHQLNHQPQAFGGTSAVAPLYAGLFAAFGKKLGFVTPRLWANQLAFHDITKGDNGYYRAGPGPDACSGLGSPIGTRLAALGLRQGSHPNAVLPPVWSGTVTHTFVQGLLVDTSVTPAKR